MKLTSLQPILWTNKLKESIAFYTEILGFKLMNENWGWAVIQKDDVLLMLALPNGHTAFKKAEFTGSFYFNTDDVDQMWQSVRDKANICYEIETFEWGMREFGIYDNCGYLLQFGQEVVG